MVELELGPSRKQIFGKDFLFFVLIVEKNKISNFHSSGTPDSNFSSTLDHSPEQNQRFVDHKQNKNRDKYKVGLKNNSRVSENPCIGPSSSPPPHTTSRPFKCRVRSCGMTFKRRAELERHRDSVHQPTSGHPCPVAGCNRNDAEHGFSRKDNLRQHLKLKHDVKFPKGRAAARG